MRVSILRRSLLVPAVAASLSGSASGQTNRIDVVTPMAPELAAYGPHAIGVRTIQVVEANRPDILNAKPGAPTPRYTRALTLEIWYPATLVAGQKPEGDYRIVTRDPAVTATIHGKAVRDAAPEKTAAAFPLVIISHGYPGNRFLLSHLAEKQFQVLVGAADGGDRAHAAEREQVERRVRQNRA
jgi:hypothetical protein